MAAEPAPSHAQEAGLHQSLEHTQQEHWPRINPEMVLAPSARPRPALGRVSREQRFQRSPRSFADCPARAPAQPESVRLSGCQTAAQLVQTTDPLLRTVVKPCPQAERSEMGGKVEQNQAYRPTLWRLQSDSAARPATRLPSDTLLALGTRQTGGQEHKPGIWAVQPPGGPWDTWSPRLSLLTVPSDKIPAPLRPSSEATPLFRVGSRRTFLCLHSASVSETAMPWREAGVLGGWVTGSGPQQVLSNGGELHVLS